MRASSRESPGRSALMSPVQSASSSARPSRSLLGGDEPRRCRRETGRRSGSACRRGSSSPDARRAGNPALQLPGAVRREAARDRAARRTSAGCRSGCRGLGDPGAHARKARQHEAGVLHERRRAVHVRLRRPSTCRNAMSSTQPARCGTQVADPFAALRRAASTPRGSASPTPGCSGTARPCRRDRISGRAA